MIIIKLIGGLGNQMFQYAAGRRAAHINKTELKLDISWFQNPEGAIKRDYLLNIFNIQESFANKEEINKLKGGNQGLWQRLCKKFFKIKDNVYLEGYWQSEKYFKDIENIIRKEFTFKAAPDNVNQKMLDRITSCDSISIHIRRGDYVVDGKTNRFHGVCDLDYYFKAVGLVAKQVKAPHFFVFSDDPTWVKQNLHLEFPCVYVDQNFGKKDYEDLRLMLSCQHNIIANSSFSWWAAWLNANPDKIIIAPKKWFAGKSIDTDDLVPASWIRL